MHLLFYGGYECDDDARKWEMREFEVRRTLCKGVLNGILMFVFCFWCGCKQINSYVKVLKECKVDTKLYRALNRIWVHVFCFSESKDE